MGERDPWLAPKNGWEGVAIAPAANMESTHWQIRFVEPWCDLGIVRIMPVVVLNVIEPSPGGAETSILEEHDAPPADQTDQIEAGRMPKDADELAIEGDEDEGGDFQSPAEPAIQGASRSVRGFAVGDVVSVKDSAGNSAGEEHIARRRGQQGVVSCICEIATACVEVTFETNGRPVMIPKAFLTQATKTHSSEGNPPCPKKKGSQMRLPI
jgi:hypothetical protein